MKLINELRIDNYILFKEWGEGDGKIGQMKRGDFGRFNNDEYHPIPITPKWLKKFGFIKDRNGWNLPGKQFSLTDNLFPCWIDRMLWPGGLPDFHQAELKHVHQLQNLYFALTGNELTTPPLP